MSSDAAHEFWAYTGQSNKYEDLVKAYEQNIERTHPDFVTSDGRGCRFCYNCLWNTTSVNYYEYTGPKVTSI